jgi:hypothetical protein
MEAYLTARAIFFPYEKDLTENQTRIVETAEHLIRHAIEDHIMQTWECAEAIVRQDGLSNKLLREKFLSRAQAAKKNAEEALRKNKEFREKHYGRGLEEPR